MKFKSTTKQNNSSQDIGWYRLDTSANIYPAIESPRDPAVFRISMRINEKVDEETLKKAAHDIRKRFPYYNVHLHKGLFWNYLEPNENDILIWNDTPSPCERLYRRTNNGHLYKIKYYDQNIAVEFFHVLADGYGATEFAKCLVHRYLYLRGKLPEKLSGIIDIDETPDKQEYEDAFLDVLEREENIPDDKDRTLFAKSHTFHTKDRLVPINMYYVVTGVADMSDMKAAAKKYNATVTQLLAALYIEALILMQDKQVKNKNDHKNVAVEIPVNMRKYYPIKSMRNFSLFVIPSVDPREVHSLEDIVAKVKEFMQEHLTHEHLLSMVKDNCSIAKNKLIKHVPVWIKHYIISYLSNTSGKMQFSGTISNLGLIRLPSEMEELVENVQFLLGANPISRRGSAVSGYKGNIYISFGRSVKDSSIERHIFTSLVKMGVKVEVKSNY